MKNDPFFPCHVDPRALGLGWLRTPPLNYDGGASLAMAIISISASLASAAISVDSSNKAAKQSELNAEAQNRALAAEQKRLAAEKAENQRRAMMDQKRFRAQQLSALAATGAMTGTGTALAIESDTWAQQQRQLADENYLAELQQRDLQYQRTSALAMGQQQAGAYRAQAAGAALSGLASAAGTYASWSPKATSVSAVPASSTYTNSRGVSQRPW